MTRFIHPCLSFGIILLMFLSCGGKHTPHSVSFDAVTEGDSLTDVPRYAKGFKLSTLSNGIRLLDISDPEKEEPRSYQYALVPRGTSEVDVPDGYQAVMVPVDRVICMTTLQLSNFIALEALEHVVGITSTRHLFNKEMNQRVKEGLTTKIGIEGNFDTEVILAAHPDLILISPFKRGGYDALKDTDIPLMPHLGYKELTPLGQAEWVKLVGVLIGEEEKANALFDSISTRYNRLKTLTAQANVRPTVMSGEMRGGNWYAVGGQSFLAQLFRDAGADYFLKDDPNSGGINLDYETVYSQAANVQYWRIMNSFDGTYSYDALKATDSRYADFRAFKDKGVIYCNMKQKPYYETMPMQPDLLLEDFVHVFHPDMLPSDYEPTYYDLLK